VLAILMFLCLPAYPVVQIWVLFRRRGWSLVLSALPVLPMTALGVQAAFAFQEGSNLFPIFLLMAAPLALLWIWIAGFVGQAGARNLR
jgi:hypothetical protein